MTGTEPVGSPQPGLTRIAVVAAISIAAGLVTWLLLIPTFNDDDFNAPRVVREANSALAAPQLVTRPQLEALVADLDTPVYWAGQQKGYNFEYTRTGDGRSFLRYLPQGERTGTASSNYTFVATYPDPNALATIRKTAGLKGSKTTRLPGGGLAVVNTRGVEIVRATSVPLPAPPVFFAKRGQKVLVEVFNVKTKDALRLVTSGQVRPVL